MQLNLCVYNKLRSRSSKRGYATYFNLAKINHRPRRVKCLQRTVKSFLRFAQHMSLARWTFDQNIGGSLVEGLATASSRSFLRQEAFLHVVFQRAV